MPRSHASITRMAAVLGAATLLGACALPVPFQVASMVIDGISYVTTEKSVADHGLSAMTGQDCALLRGLADGQPCREIEDAEDAAAMSVAAADDAPVQPEPVTAAPVAKQDAPIAVASASRSQVAPAEAAPAPAAVTKAALKAEPVRVPENGLYLIVGSFIKESDALRHAVNLQTLTPKVLHGKVKGVPVYRVGLGPLRGRDLAEARNMANGFGVYDAWAVRVMLPPRPADGPTALQAAVAN